MRPGDTVVFPFWRRKADGTPSTGKLLADHAVAASKNGSTVSLSPSLAEGATVGTWREYFLTGTLPAAGPYNLGLLIAAASGTDQIMGGAFSGEIEAHDMDSTAALATRTIAVVANTGGLGADVQLRVSARRRNKVRVTLLDQNGNPVDLSGYSNWRFTVWDKTHSGVSALYSLAAGITGSAAGAIAFDLPEGSAFYSASDTAIAASNDLAVLYYDLIADEGGVAASTDCIMRGQILCDRWEGAA